MNEPEHSFRQALKRKASFFQTMRAVIWSFFGVRKSSEYEKDVNQLNPLHVIIAGILMAVVFIAILIGIVNWVLSSGVAS